MDGYLCCTQAVVGVCEARPSAVALFCLETSHSPLLYSSFLPSLLPSLPLLSFSPSLLRYFCKQKDYLNCSSTKNSSVLHYRPKKYCAPLMWVVLFNLHFVFVCFPIHIILFIWIILGASSLFYFLFRYLIANQFFLFEFGKWRIRNYVLIYLEKCTIRVLIARASWQNWGIFILKMTQCWVGYGNNFKKPDYIIYHLSIVCFFTFN